jgi:hypothetical protein
MSLNSEAILPVIFPDPCQLAWQVNESSILAIQDDNHEDFFTCQTSWQGSENLE